MRLSYFLREIAIPGILIGLTAYGIVNGLGWAIRSDWSSCGRTYSGAARERCMMRLKAGGPLYEENVGYRP